VAGRSAPGVTKAAFDRYAGTYDAALANGLAVTGENKEYFARGRIRWLARCLSELGERPQSALDFGCGTGSAAELLLDIIGLERLVGVDPSPKLIEEARQTFGSPRASFTESDRYEPNARIDLAFCNGVFHHIPPGDRPAAVDLVHRSLRPGGLFAFWENNPWNPGTRYVMSRISFDRDAITLTPSEASRLLAAGGFEVLRTDYLFIFPRALRALRRIELRLARLPLGAQYEVLCRKRA
jgi:SAM-dependent methyltransferase